MERQVHMQERSGGEDSRRGFRRIRRRPNRRWTALGLLLILIVGILLLPSLVCSGPIRHYALDRFAGLAPLKLRFEHLQAGWLAPVRASGISLLDPEDRVLARIESLATEKSILGWLRASSDLGTITIRGAETRVIAQDGSTDLEQALQPLIELVMAEPVEPDSGESTSGTIELLDSKVLLEEAGQPQRWLLDLQRLSLVLPNQTQLIGPVELRAQLSEVSGGGAERPGQVAFSVRPSGESETLELRARMEAVPVDFWHLVHARLPELPLEGLRGNLSATVAGSWRSFDDWHLDLQQLQSGSLQVIAPELVGPSPASIELLSASGRCRLSDRQFEVLAAQLACGFGSATATARLPWPIQMPGAAEPFIPGATLEAEGYIELPKLAVAAKSLLPMRQDLQLTSGAAAFSLSQTCTAEGSPRSQAQLQLTGLSAVRGGQTLRWDEPLRMELTAERLAAPARVRFGALCAAEFCQLNGSGTLEAGELSGSLNLDLLYQKLSRWIELPIRELGGAVRLGLAWRSTAEKQLVAEGELDTTPLVIASTTGGQISEPAWNGRFSCTAEVDGGLPTLLSEAEVLLRSQQEQLTVQLTEPLALSTAQQQASKQQPAAFSIDLQGELANWQRRATVWLSQPPEVQLEGEVKLAATGRIDLEHVELLQANWSMQPLIVATPQMRFAEPQMRGNFKGRVDSSDLSRLIVEKLEVQATSFSLGAQDAAGTGGAATRVGRAMFLVDLERLTRNIGESPSGKRVLPPGMTSPAGDRQRLLAAGRAQGQLAWQVGGDEAAIHLNLEAKPLTVLSQSPADAQPVVLWTEPQLQADVQGNWKTSTSTLQLQSTVLRTPWMSYTGTLAYNSQADAPTIDVEGQAVYQAEQVAEKIRPWTGGKVRMSGQQTVPVRLTWSSQPNESGSALAGLEAMTRIGWQEAHVVGIDLGKADVPVTITGGSLATSAEIPVSGGVLRWDLTSDLTAPEIVVMQKPMRVLENVAITPEMCQSWLKYVTPLLAETTSVDGRLSLQLDRAELNPANPSRQSIAGELVIHSAEVGPGPLSNQLITLVQQINAIRKQEFTQPVSSQRVWLQMPEQRIPFEMLEGKIVHRNLSIRAGDVTLSTTGTVDLDGRMEMLASMPIPEEWVKKSPWLVGMRGQSVQIPVRGTLSAPQVDMSFLQQFGRQTIQGAAQTALQQGLSRGLEKLFGPPPTAPAAPSGE